MKLLFLTLSGITSIENHGIYSDLLREFARRDHQVFVVSPSERRTKQKTRVIYEKNATFLKVATGNLQKANLFEKGISTVLLDHLMIRGIKKHFNNVRFDLILYSTPPVTLDRVISFLKKRDNAKTYLLLKDIFPQNAVDLGVLSPHGVKGLLYRYFKKKEKNLYALADRIGCMSKANVDYTLKHNPEIESHRIEICPNSIEIRDFSISDSERMTIRNKYGIPLEKTTFVYGGNFGKPQGIPFIIECLRKLIDHPKAYFLIIGSGTEYGKLEKFFSDTRPANMQLLKFLPKKEYELMVPACDVGLVFLDHRFTIPNFPSRLLSYMQASLPVLACTDPNTDVGEVITDGGFGWWCPSNPGNSEKFRDVVDAICANDSLKDAGKRGNEFLKQNYSITIAYNQITNNL